MTRGDQLIERAARRLDELARGAAADGGIRAKLAKPLAEDAQLLRGMRPSLIAARARGRAGGERASAAARTEPLAPVEPQSRRERGGPNPLAVAAGAFLVGLLIARLVDWRSHAHPRL